MQQHRGGAAIANAACGRSRDVLSDSIQGAALRAEAVLGPQLLLVLGWHKALLPSLCFAARWIWEFVWSDSVEKNVGPDVKLAFV